MLLKLIPLEERIVLDAAAVAAVHASTTTHPANEPYGVFPLAGHDQQNSGVANDTLINTRNVSTLVKGWNLQTGVAGDTFNAQPVIADGVVYTASFNGTVYAIQESSGKVLWQTTVTVNDGNGASPRTENFLTSPSLTQNTLYIASDYLTAINRQTGAVLWQQPLLTAAEKATFIADGIPLNAVQGGQVQLAGNYLIVGRYFGTEGAVGNLPTIFDGQDQKVLIFDSSTGALVHSLDLSVVDGVQYGPGGTFSMAGIDIKDHLAFIGTGNNYTGPSSPLSDSLIAIDYTTGQIVWHYQFNSNDVWNVTTPPDPGAQDMDVSTHANVFTLDGVTYVGQGSKDGTYRIFTALQSDPNNVQPVAMLKLGPAAVSGTIQATPIINNGIMYIAVCEAYNPLTNTVGSLDYVTGNPLLGGPFAPIFLGVTNLFAINLNTVIQSGTQGPLPLNAVLWERTLSPFTNNPTFVDSPNGLTYDNGVIFMDSLQGKVTEINASNGAIIGTITPIPNQTVTYLGQTFTLDTPIVGGISVDFGRIFVASGIEGIGYGALTEYELPIMQQVDRILNSPQSGGVTAAAAALAHNGNAEQLTSILAAIDPSTLNAGQQNALAFKLAVAITADNQLIDDELWI